MDDETHASDAAQAGGDFEQASIALGTADAERLPTGGEETGPPPEVPEPAKTSALEGGMGEADGRGAGETVETPEEHPAERQTKTQRSWMRPLQSRRGGCMPRLSIAAILVVCLLALASVEAVNAYTQYTHVRSEATNGVLHLKHAQALLAPVMKRPGIPDTATLRTVEGELAAAQQDFTLTRRDLGVGVFSLAARAPAARGALDTVATLASAAEEACQAGLELLGDADTLIPVLHGGIIAGAAPPASSTASSSPPPPTLTTAMFHQLTANFEDAVRHIATAIAYVRNADLSSLPPNLVTPQQMAELSGLLAQWPRIAPQLGMVDAWLQVAPSLLGLDAPERLLVELMDRGEMRATGGYIGDYGVMTIQAGKILPFSLNDVYSLDRPYMWRANWPSAPPAYPWWPFPGFALRDSNLSANFPTAAQVGIHLLAVEGGPHVQGVVALTAPAIERVLAIIGPVAVPEYHETVTAQNLERLIRVYTENPDVLGTELHERFTAVLGHAFVSKLRGLPADQLVPIARTLLTSLQSKDIQVYLSDTAAEALLSQQGLDASMTHGPGDGVTIVDANVDISKANVFTTVTYTDAVTLDTNGTATHHLTITYHFDTRTNPGMLYFLYGRDYYLTYLRVYTPPGARLASFDGFNGGSEEINASDEPGHQMWGGYVHVQDGVPYSLHFVWSVPNAATGDTPGLWSYTLDVQHQTGSNQQLKLTISVPGSSTPAAFYRGALDQDRTYSVTYFASGGARWHHMR